MKILGIDPGVARMGWAIIEERSGTITPLAYGCLTTDKETDAPVRLKELHEGLTELIATHTPDCLSVEDLFFATNAKTAISVGQSRGIVLLAAAQKQLPVASYSPLAIKRTIAGDGKADKKQVERMVMMILKLKVAPKPDDTVDALAIAMTHAFAYKIRSL